MVAQVDSAFLKTRPTKVITRLISYAFFEGRPVTTRGQWINPVVFALFALEKRLPQLRKVEKPLFILGSGRSGTTILGTVLAMHRDVGFLNEPKALWHSIYESEDVIGSYSRGVAHYRLNASAVTNSIRRSAHRLFGAYLATVFAKRVVDKYPELIFRVPFVREIFPDARFVLLVRNGWDTCRSIDNWSARMGKQKNGEVHDWWGVDRRKWTLMVSQLIEPDPYFCRVTPRLSEIDNHSDMAALEWIVTMREGLRQLKASGDCMLLVKYEDLVNSPRRMLSDIAEFGGYSSDRTFLDYGEQTIKAGGRHEEFDMHPEIRPLFEETMAALGYQ